MPPFLASLPINQYPHYKTYTAAYQLQTKKRYKQQPINCKRSKDVCSVLSVSNPGSSIVLSCISNKIFHPSLPTIVLNVSSNPFIMYQFPKKTQISNDLSTAKAAKRYTLYSHSSTMKK